MREPSAGRLESGALVRTMIQCRSSHAFAGKVNVPVKAAPACNSTVSPQFALFNACWRFPPAATLITLPGAGEFRSEEHTSEFQSQSNIVCRLLLEKKKKKKSRPILLKKKKNTITNKKTKTTK